MKVKELIAKLSEKDPELEVEFITSTINHYCGSNDYCYCTSDQNYFSIDYVSDFTVFNKKRKVHDVTKICLQGSEN